MRDFVTILDYDSLDETVLSMSKLDYFSGEQLELSLRFLLASSDQD